MQSTVGKQAGFHVAIIMDGNGRWATRRGLARSAGHRRGVLAARRVTQAAPHLGVTTLTLFAFSSDNWRRPRAEVNALMSLLRHYLVSEARRLVENGIRLTVIGRRDRLPDGLSEAIRAAEEASAAGRRLSLRIAIDYSSRDAIAAAAARWFAERAWDRKPWLAFVGFAIASVVPFLFGVPYLAYILNVVGGAQLTFLQVLEAGVFPFIVGGIIKALIAALLIPAAWALVRKADASKR